MTYEQIYELRQNVQLKKRIAVAVALEGRYILDSNDVNAARTRWARESLLQPEGRAENFMWLIATDSGVQTAGPDAVEDAVLRAIVTANVNLFAIV